MTSPPPAASTRPGRAGLAVRLVLLAASMAVALLAGELAVRLLQPQPLHGHGHFYRPDDQLDFHLAPGYDGRFTNHDDFDTRVRINRDGLRGPALARDRPGLLGLGDSFLFGYGVEDEQTFLTHAAQALGLEPLNAGVPAYDVGRASRIGLRLLPAHQPAAVTLSIFLGNDEVDSAPGAVRLRVENGGLVAPDKRRSPPRALAHGLFRRSHLLRLLRGLAGNPDAVRPILAPYLDPPAEAVLAGDPEIGRAIAALADACRVAGVPLVVVLIPEKLEVVESDLARVRRGARMEGARLDLDGPRRRVLAAIGDSSAIVIDARDALRAASDRGESVYLPRDRHLSPAGHAVVGRLLAGTLRPLVATPGVPTQPDPAGP